jgi:ketosteroid isomerase-like protein
MLSWLAKRVVTYQMEHLSAGDLRPVLLFDAPDVHMTFPGESSWATDLHGKVEHERWLRRFATAGIQIYADEVVAQGPQWNTTLCVRGRDYMRSKSGELAYENRFVLWGQMSWGRLKRYEVYEDTQKTLAFDRWLIENQPELAAA